MDCRVDAKGYAASDRGVSAGLSAGTTAGLSAGTMAAPSGGTTAGPSAAGEQGDPFGVVGGAPPPALLSRPIVLFVVGVIAVSILYVLLHRCTLPGVHSRVRTLELVNTATAYAIGGIFWPVVFGALIGPRLAGGCSLCLLGLAWPLVMMFVDLLWITRQPLDPEDTKKGSFVYDANALSGLALALGSLLLSQVGDRLAKSAAPALSACVFLVLAFVIPTPGVPVRSGLGALLLSFRKIAMAYCVGLLIAAVAISLQMSVRRESA
tara:strand:+ start:8272 stop:9066 length:795 start_codon:yes stop_codon:yes gene_type:complete